jgi:hypothetical protein
MTLLSRRVLRRTEDILAGWNALHTALSGCCCRWPVLTCCSRDLFSSGPDAEEESIDIVRSTHVGLIAKCLLIIPFLMRRERNT